MKNKSIPKPHLEPKNSIPKPSFVPSGDTNIVFSFASLEWTDYFGLDGTCNNWSFDLFNMLKDISTKKKIDLIQDKYKKYRVHTHETATPPNQLPSGIALKDCYQIRISQSKGGIHGIFVENVFYVIWLDPLHNMYPDDRFGGLRKIKPPNTCCRDREEKISKLERENKELKTQNEYWESEFRKL